MEAIQSILGFQMEEIAYIRAPFYAILLKPMAALPCRVAPAIFFGATLHKTDGFRTESAGSAAERCLCF